MKVILITGAAGFIGSNLAKRILCEEQDVQVIGIDSMTDYYDVNLKKDRLQELGKFGNFIFVKGDIADKATIQEVFSEYRPEVVVNLAAQAGVRYSIDNPDVYIASNMIGFYNILEACRHSYDMAGRNPSAPYHGVRHLVFASSSSVYGSNEKVPYSTDDRVDNPVSLYAATKKSNELMAHAYSKLYGIPCTGLRFFTVYGPAGRPDMAYFKFTNKMVKGEKIQIYNYGDMKRDFTYIDDIVSGVRKVMARPAPEDGQGVRYKIYNIGNHKPENLLHFVEVLEQCLIKEGIVEKEAEKELLPMQPGDVYQTYADIDDLSRDFGFCPNTPLEVGLRQFAKWYKTYYK
ncbi:MAG: NAD-dependent epimerase/dehydratase family protein [Eubacterium sp.]|nr:NAD-dependent epimerase/dehydratase family protein [Eubacterium sp.]